MHAQSTRQRRLLRRLFAFTETAFDAAGQIAGYYVDASGAAHGFLLK